MALKATSGGGGVASNQHLSLRLQQDLPQPLLSQNRS
jgi:hypothetical protein